MPLTLTAPLSSVICRSDGAWLPLTTAALTSGKVGRAGGVWVPLSAGVPLTGRDCGADDAWVLLSAALLLTGPCAGMDVVEEFSPSHAQRARAQMPTVANPLTATAAPRNLVRRLCVPSLSVPIRRA